MAEFKTSVREWGTTASYNQEYYPYVWEDGYIFVTNVSPLEVIPNLSSVLGFML